MDIDEIGNDYYRLLLLATSQSSKQKIDLLKEIHNKYPEVYHESHRIFKSWYPQTFNIPYELLNPSQLGNNIVATQLAMGNYVRQTSPRVFSTRAMQKLYAPLSPFNLTQQLYKNNYDKLRVRDVLDVIGYATRTINTVSDIDIKSVEQGLLVLNGIELALNNNEYDKPAIQLTHYAVDILSYLAKDMKSDPQKHKVISFGTSVIHLVISFLTKE